MIDLHTHTTASDGRCSPAQLVERAAAAGLTTLAVTDHDTVAATGEVASLCAAHGIRAVSGIEITAMEGGRDVHLLGYFLDPDEAGLQSFLQRQREERVQRVLLILSRLASLGMPIVSGSLMESARANDGRSIGRPQIARAMIEAGYVSSVNDAFEAWLGHGRPAFVPRHGSGAAHVIDVIHAAGGIASLAHPGETRIDPQIPALREAGLDAIEAYHSDHSPETRAHYVQMAAALGLLVTGGSDYHGDPEHGIELGSIGLPEDEWERMTRRMEELTK